MELKLITFLKYICVVTALSSTLVSCIKDVDFEQAEGLSISPALEVSVIHFEEPVSKFVDDLGDEIVTVRDSVGVEIFNDDFVVENLVRADFLFKITNTINRAYDAQIDFYNDFHELQHSFGFGVGASMNSQDIIVEYIEVFEGQELEALKTTTNLVLTLTLQPSTDGSTLNENSIGNLELESKASFYFDINTSSE